MSERTTVRLPEDLIRHAKRRAAADGRTLTALIEDGLRRVLSERVVRTVRVMPPVSEATGGLVAGIDLGNSATIWESEDVAAMTPAPVILADVNVLIYAFRRDAPNHDICKPWLDGVIGGEAQFGISPLALAAVARIVTNPRIFRGPSSTSEAFAFCDSLLTQPHCEVVEPGSRHWLLFTGLCQETNIRGPLISDAWFAALAIERGCTWITFDRDYARFPGLDWRTPGP